MVSEENQEISLTPYIYYNTDSKNYAAYVPYKIISNRIHTLKNFDKKYKME